MILFVGFTGNNISNCDFFFSHRPNGRKVVLGVHSLSEPEDTKQTFDILELHNHPDFSHVNYDNDIALIKVSVCFVYVCLCRRNNSTTEA